MIQCWHMHPPLQSEGLKTFGGNMVARQLDDQLHKGRPCTSGGSLRIHHQTQSRIFTLLFAHNNHSFADDPVVLVRGTHGKSTLFMFIAFSITASPALCVVESAGVHPSCLQVKVGLHPGQDACNIETQTTICTHHLHVFGLLKGIFGEKTLRNRENFA